MRMIAEDVRIFLQSKGAAPLIVYMMEQVTEFYRWMGREARGSTVIGSEFLGVDIASGSVVNGIRHENAEQLSFANASVDLVISNEVLEHVNDPERVIAEIVRVLRVGGSLFLTTPFDPNKDESVRRARLVSGGIQHLLPPVYHGNPLSKDGSLVFNDFGWELVSLLERAGFRSVSIVVHWGFEKGHLGDVFYFRCIR
jgi:SAM-dependent methyltransferase